MLVKSVSVLWQPPWTELAICMNSCISAIMLAPGHVCVLWAMKREWSLSCCCRSRTAGCTPGRYKGICICRPSVTSRMLVSYLHYHNTINMRSVPQSACSRYKVVEHTLTSSHTTITCKHNIIQTGCPNLNMHSCGLYNVQSPCNSAAVQHSPTARLSGCQSSAH